MELDNQLLIVFGGVVGSIVTVLITKIIEFLQKEKDFKNNLKTKYFLKKLQVAEVVIARGVLVSNSLSELVLLLNRFYKDHTDTSQNLNDALVHLAEKLEFAASPEFNIANSVDLYFDIQSEINSNDLLKLYFSKMDTIGIYDERTKKTQSELMQARGTNLEKIAKEKNDAANEELLFQIKDISQEFEDLNLLIKKNIELIKKEIRKYGKF